MAREIEIHAGLHHSSIIKLYAAFEDKDGIYLVEELATKGVINSVQLRKVVHESKNAIAMSSSFD